MTQYKDFSTSSVISFDVETYDPDLVSKGPAVYRGGYVLGFSLADNTGFKEYYNLRHIDTNKEEAEKNLKFLKEIMAFDIPKLGMNILYDLDWIQNYLGIKVNGQLWDIMVAESLINENQGKYNLDFMANKYLELKKVRQKIDIYCEQHDLKGDPRQWLWKMPYSMVRDYAIGDVILPLEIFKIQWKILNNENLLDIFHMEMEDFPLLLHMRKTGVPIDIKKLNLLMEIFCDKLIEYENQLENMAGFEVNYNASASIAKACDKYSIQYPLTIKTRKPSFTKPWLEKNKKEHPLFELILRCRKYSKLINTFLESQIKRQLINDKIHGQFHPCKAEKGGTVTGRFSASNPNLQFIPNPKSDEMSDKDEIQTAHEIRSLFIPFEDHYWGRIDYSQIEVRLLAHFAVGPKSEEIRNAFINNPNTDYHKWCAELSGLTRTIAKNLNFGVIYGMGLMALCDKFGMSLDDGTEFLEIYNNTLPFAKQTLYAVKNRAEHRGYVRTILGRRRRFPNKDFSYKALNAVIQGSAADIMKKGMVDSWKAGIYNEIIPLLTVHDEMDVSVPRKKSSLEAYKELSHIMSNAVKLKVPITTDMEIGKNWGYLEAYDERKRYL